MSALNHSPRRAARALLRFASLLSTCVVFGAPAQAEPRLLTPEEHVQWQAIGRVNQAGFKSRSLCTGTLVAPDQVLTAAHCFNPDAFDPVVFVAGWYRGEFVAARKVVSFNIGEGFVLGAPPSTEMVARDWALLQLEAEILDVTPIPVGTARLGQSVDLTAYSGTTPHALTTRSECAVAEEQRVRGAQDILVVACPVRPGNSGGPVLLQDETGWHVVAVVSASTGFGTTLAVVPAPAAQELTR